MIISEYIEGIPIKNPSIEQIKRLGIALAKLHNTQIEADQTLLRADTHETSSFSYEPVLCHNDLNHMNIIWKNGYPKLIDWEYAGINDRYFDIASVLVEFDLDDDLLDAFLYGYFNGNDTIYKTKLEAYVRLYKAVCSVWEREREKISLQP